MTDASDEKLYRAESEIRAQRAPFPCFAFQAIARSIPLCDWCGWYFEAHLDRAHEEAIEMDEELND